MNSYQGRAGLTARESYNDFWSCVRSFKDCIYLGIGRQATHAREERTDNNNNKKETTGTVQYNTIQYWLQY